MSQNCVWLFVLVHSSSSGGINIIRILRVIIGMQTLHNTTTTQCLCAGDNLVLLWSPELNRTALLMVNNSNRSKDNYIIIMKICDDFIPINRSTLCSCSRGQLRSVTTEILGQWIGFTGTVYNSSGAALRCTLLHWTNTLALWGCVFVLKNIVNNRQQKIHKTLGALQWSGGASRMMYSTLILVLRATATWAGL